MVLLESPTVLLESPCLLSQMQRKISVKKGRTHNQMFHLAWETRPTHFFLHTDKFSEAVNSISISIVSVIHFESRPHVNRGFLALALSENGSLVTEQCKKVPPHELIRNRVRGCNHLKTPSQC